MCNQKDIQKPRCLSCGQSFYVPATRNEPADGGCSLDLDDEDGQCKAYSEGDEEDGYASACRLDDMADMDNLKHDRNP